MNYDLYPITEDEIDVSEIDEQDSKSDLIGWLAGYLVDNLSTGQFHFFKKREYAEIRKKEWEAGGCSVKVTELFEHSAC